MLKQRQGAPADNDLNIDPNSIVSGLTFHSYCVTIAAFLTVFGCEPKASVNNAVLN